MQGLQDLLYSDKTSSTLEILKEAESGVSVENETDRIYQAVKWPVILVETQQKTVTLEADDFHDVVVWNPWKDKAHSMSDFDDQEYHNMICIEPASIETTISLEPNQSNKATHSIHVQFFEAKQ